MKVKNGYDFGHLRQVLLFSNTPGFMLRQFRRDTIVTEYSKNMTVKSLIKIFDAAIKRRLKTINDCVDAFVAIAAISLREYSVEQEEFFKEVAKHENSWLAELGSICLSGLTSTKTIVTSFQYKPTAPEVREIGAKASVSTANIYIGSKDRKEG